jgi:hypothetical protein
MLHLEFRTFGARSLKTLSFVLLFASSLLIVVALAANGQQQSEGPQNGSGATRLKPKLTISKKTQYVSCWNKRNQLIGSRLVRTPILASPNGSHRAYVEVEATAFQPKDLATYVGPLCENTSRLFFAGSGEAKFTVLFSQSQDDFLDGNSLTLVDWSPDGAQLLMERTRWKTDFVVFNTNSRTVTKPDHTSESPEAPVR